MDQYRLLVARVSLAAVWLVSGALKVADPAQTIVAVRAYQLLPEDLVRPVANALPFFEIALGLLLLIGLGVRATAVVSAALLLVLVGVIISVWARGLSIDCGCFGGGERPTSMAGTTPRKSCGTSDSSRWRPG